MTRVEIFSAEVCPYAHRTRLVLLEKKIDYLLTEIDLKNKPGWFHEVSPYGKVPSIRHSGNIIFESAIINEYLDEVFPNPALMPTDPNLRALARIWIDYGNTRFNSTVYKLVRELNKEKQGLLRDELNEVCRYIEESGLKRFGNGPFWMGSDITLVDLSYYPFFERLCTAEYYRNYVIPADCRLLYKWIDSMAERESVRSISHSQEFYIERARVYAEPRAL